MSMANTVARCLGRKRSGYDTVRRRDGAAGAEIAEGERVPFIPADRLARAILLEDHRGYVTAVVPSSHHLKLSELCMQSGRQLSRARADGVHEVFRDCASDSLPPVGMAYHTLTWLDESLLTHPDVYFESGDGTELVHMRTDAFEALMDEAHRGHFAHRAM